jgi:hypothetical protein
VSSPLLHSPADVLATLLVDLGLGTDPADGGAWPVSVSREPDLPDRAVTVFDTLGRSDGYSLVDGEHYLHHGFQVRVRSDTHEIGAAKAWGLATSLNEDADASHATVSIDGSIYCVGVVTCGGVYPLGTDATSKRRIHVFNGFLTLRKL